jgi:hypothetical protein
MELELSLARCENLRKNLGIMDFLCLQVFALAYRCLLVSMMKTFLLELVVAFLDIELLLL